MQQRTGFIFLILLICLVILALADILVGSLHISIADVWNICCSEQGDNTIAQNVLFEYRIPKMSAAVLSGMALACSGLLMQTLFRNPLAGPDVLGISSGASFGVALYVLGFSSIISSFGFQSLNDWMLIVPALLGAVGVLFVIMLITSRVKDIMTVLIIGIMTGAVFTAVVNIMQYMSSEQSLKSYVIWTMGSLGNITREQFPVFISGISAGLVLAIVSIKYLDALLIGETYACSLGVHVTMGRYIVFFSTGLLTGTVTAFCGPIIFVGVAVPHIARLLMRTSRHNVMIPATILCGAIFMLISDIFCSIGDDLRIPINSVTLLMGIPVILWIIFRNKKIAM